MSNDKVLVALKTEPKHSPADRWTTWARSIIDRHERMAARQGRLIMTLVQPLRMFTSINQRLEKFALAVFPRIQISIGPILQELARAQLPSVPSAQKSLVFPRLRGVTALENTAVLKSYAATASDRKQLKSRSFLPASMTLASAPFHATQLTPGTSGDSSFTDQASNALKNFSQSPMDRLFARLRRQNQGVAVKKLLLQNESQAIAQRVVQEHLRVEQRKRGDMVMRKQNIPGGVAENRRHELEAQFATTNTRERSWPEKSPEINVEQLTEQVIRRIDHRITAYRERLGRAF